MINVLDSYGIPDDSVELRNIFCSVPVAAVTYGPKKHMSEDSERQME